MRPTEPFRVLEENAPYHDLYSTFRWRIPEHYNIAVDVCDRWAERQPERVAIIHKEIGSGTVTRVTYGDLKDRSSRLAAGLLKRGISRGDRIGLLLPQTPETAIGHIAAYRLGAVAVPLALLFGADALEYRLADCAARCVITNAQGAEKINGIRDRLPGLECVLSIDGPDGDVLGFQDLLDRADPHFVPADTKSDDPALMVYTSGTTGPPKGALHAHRVLLGHLPGVEFSHEFFPRHGDCLWTPADWAWAGGLLNVLLPGLRYGVPVVACPFGKFDPEQAFDLMAEFGVANCFIPPTALKLLRAVERPAQRYDLNLRTIGSGGETLGREIVEWGQAELGLTINEFYGQTECNYVLSSCAALGVSQPGAIGRPVPGHKVGIVKPDGTIARAGDTGQISVQSPDPVMFLKYWGKPEATRDKFIGEWMTTGDQGMMDEQGFVHFLGRDDDVITSAGYRIGPGEIEDCLLGHAAVALVAAIGKPDPVRTEIVKVFVVLNNGHKPSDALASELRDHVRHRLSAHEYPREVEFIDELPLTTTGKVIRRLLRDRA